MDNTDKILNERIENEYKDICNKFIVSLNDRIQLNNDIYGYSNKKSIDYVTEYLQSRNFINK